MLVLDMRSSFPFCLPSHSPPLSFFFFFLVSFFVDGGASTGHVMAMEYAVRGFHTHQVHKRTTNTTTVGTDRKKYADS